MTDSTRPYHAAKEVLDPYLLSPDPSAALVAAKCFGLLAGYDQRWRFAPYKIDSVESVMQSDLYNPETTRKSRTFTIAGKLDIRATEILTGAKVLLDHKTTSVNIADPGEPYWKILAIEGQVSHYMLLEWLNQNKVDVGIWDVVRKPGISPRAVAKTDAFAVTDTRRYYELELDDVEMDKFLVDKRETPLMYAARLANDCTVEQPERYFQRRQVARLDAEIQEYATELWGHSQDIIAARATERWPRNSGACFNYNSACKFLGICSGHDTPESGAWNVVNWVHPELPILNNGRGLEVLTNSRVRTFQSCRRKHFYQYEMGIQKIDEEEKEALFFGSLFHSALEQYFLALKQLQERGIA
jgi:hypothetical protein